MGTNLRILFVTNHYPPSLHSWGYQQLCEEVADRLHAKGHAVAVLTSRSGRGEGPTHPYPVYRVLSIDPDWHRREPAAWQFFVGRRRRERRSAASSRRVIGLFRPDVVFVWHYAGLPRVLLRAVEQSRQLQVAYFLADYLPEIPDEYAHYWRVPARHRIAQLAKYPLSQLAACMLRLEGKPVALKYAHAICVSDYVRERLVTQGLVPADAVVVHNGVDLEQFTPRLGSLPDLAQGLRCLVAGRVVPDKGVHTAIEALAHPTMAGHLSRVSLTVLGSGPQPYLEHLADLVHDANLEDVVRFRAPVPRTEMPRMLAAHNVLLLPSQYAEPLARAAQEAMAMGLLVIGTTTGGSGELLAHDQTGLVFEPGDSQSLAQALVGAVCDPGKAARLARLGQERVVESFDIRRTVDELEHYLRRLVARKEAAV